MTSHTSETKVQYGVRLTGRVVSRGTASGAVFVLSTGSSFAEIRDILTAEVEGELSKFDSAKRQVSDELRAMVGERSRSFSDDAHEIVEAQIAILSDQSFTDKISSRISTDRLGAQLAVRIVSDEYIDQLRSLDDKHLREKAIDMQDLSDRLIAAIGGDVSALDIPTGSVIVCAEVWPSTILKLAEFKPAAIVTESGGWTSHAFILARELGIPAISGVRNVHQRLSTGETVVVDAINGHIFLDGTNDHAAPSISTLDKRSDLSTSPKVTLADGTELEFLANVDSPEKCRQAIERGVNEIGLIRSEYLFDLNGRLPDESLQDKTYAEIAAAAIGRRIAIRTFDVSIERLVASSTRRERNPALGMRSIRLSFRYERQFRAQLRSLIRANSDGNINVVVPMVSGASDILRVTSLLDREFDELSRTDSNAKCPSVGAMIELPSAVLTVDQILEVADFVCIGTNDLVQYTLGVDRDNEAVADWYQTLHPAILRSLKTVNDAAKAKGKLATICGEAAGSPFYLPLLVGLGFQRLSMNPSSIASMIEHARVLSLAESSNLTETLLRSDLTSQNEKLLTEFCHQIWPDLEGERVNFPPKIG